MYAIIETHLAENHYVNNSYRTVELELFVYKNFKSITGSPLFILT